MIVVQYSSLSVSRVIVIIVQDHAITVVENHSSTCSIVEVLIENTAIIVVVDTAYY